jgi:hypothetical protein
MTNVVPRILSCHRACAQAVPRELKQAVLKPRCEAGVAVEAVADLCEMSARRDPALALPTDNGSVTVATRDPRDVNWHIAATRAPLPAVQTGILYLRVQGIAELAGALLSPMLNPKSLSGEAGQPTPDELLAAGVSS